MRQRLQKISRYSPSIFQGKLNFANTSRHFSFTVAHPAEYVALRAIIFILLALACAYIYFVGVTALNVIARKEALSRATSLQSSLSALESDYYMASADITPEIGARLGLVAAEKTAYVKRPGATALSRPNLTTQSAATIGPNEI